ncbi:hypothetical protein CDAR_216251 [Caerostris darwini]|uniref:Uncharacterized protein n=1 Tax=Caerostris darwini TaxID=1538125 RepID=A0AAV4SLW1_9ARAC|nr:hypothetical protein CDAR_216251 [Caerostris darwini]
MFSNQYREANPGLTLKPSSAKPTTKIIKIPGPSCAGEGRPPQQLGSVRPGEPQQNVELNRAASPGAAPQDRQQTELQCQPLQGHPQPPALPHGRDGHLNTAYPNTPNRSFKEVNGKSTFVLTFFLNGNSGCGHCKMAQNELKLKYDCLRFKFTKILY